MVLLHTPYNWLELAGLNAAFIRIGLSACDVGVSYFLPRIVGSSIAAELLLTGDFIDAPRALRTSLVSCVVPDAELDRTAEVCQACNVSLTADSLLTQKMIGL